MENPTITWKDVKDAKGVVTKKLGSSDITEYVLTPLADRSGVSMAYYDIEGILQRIQATFNNWASAQLACEWHLQFSFNEMKDQQKLQAL